MDHKVIVINLLKLFDAERLEYLAGIVSTFERDNRNEESPHLIYLVLKQGARNFPIYLPNHEFFNFFDHLLQSAQLRNIHGDLPPQIHMVSKYRETGDRQSHQPRRQPHIGAIPGRRDRPSHAPPKSTCQNRQSDRRRRLCRAARWLSSQDRPLSKDQPPRVPRFPIFVPGLV